MYKAKEGENIHISIKYRKWMTNRRISMESMGRKM
jgi:hypothetical protein